MNLFHYTDKGGWDAIRAQKTWKFKASQPQRSDRPFGVYFTDIAPTETNLRLLYKRLRIPKTKQEYAFWFIGSHGLTQLNGGLGRDKCIFFSSADYEVESTRQRHAGTTPFSGEVFP